MNEKKNKNFPRLLGFALILIGSISLLVGMYISDFQKFIRVIFVSVGTILLIVGTILFSFIDKS